MSKLQTEPDLFSSCLRKTPFGTVAVVWSAYMDSPGILGILLPAPEKEIRKEIKRDFPGSRNSSCREINEYADKLEDYLNGGKTVFSTDILRLDLCTDFRRRTLLANFAVPRGKVSTYGQLAAHLGSPGASRAVGSAMATNPFPIAIPCHRVISSDRSLGGYGGGLKMKKAFLEMEGVVFGDGKYVTDESLFQWKN